MTTKKFPILGTDRLYLRQFNDTDLDNVFNGLSHPDVIQYYGVSFRSLEATKEQMLWFSNLEKNATGIWWAICAKGDGKFLGAGGLNDLDRENKKAEIGFWLLPENWGRGIMTEAIPLILNHAFNNLGLHRVEGFVETENENCIKALLKLKFKHEGTMKDCEVKNGKMISLQIFAKFKNETH
jgi:ribosomal-protein-alanine N-acetyltransferase